MKSVFVKTYLLSTSAILLLAAVAKLVSSPVSEVCQTTPLLGALQHGRPNLPLLWLVAAIELGIVALCLYSENPGLSSAAATLWGFGCLSAHLFISSPAACGCLGGLQQLLPVSAGIVSKILVLLAGWIAAGGLVSLQISTGHNPARPQRHQAGLLVTPNDTRKPILPTEPSDLKAANRF